MSRSSSSSASTPSRMTPPSRASAGGSSTSVAAIASRTSARSSSSPTQAADERRRPSARARRRTRGIARERLAQRDEVARAGGAERHARRRGARDRGRRAACRAAGRARSARKANSSTASRRSWMRSSATSGRSSQRAQQARAHRRSASDRARDSSDPSRPPSAPSSDLEVAERHRIDEQAVAALAPADGADVREIDLLRVAQVLDQRAGGARPPRRWPSSPKRVQAARCCSCSQSVRCGAVDAERSMSSSGVTAMREARRSRAAAPPASTPCGTMISRGRSTPELLVERLAPVVAGVLGGEELAGRDVEQRHAEAIAGSPGASASRNAGSRASR